MICNAIYSVSRTARLVFQHPQSPWHLSRLGEKPLPLLRFTDSAPVYFDRHTLNVRQSGLSMYSLDGRLHFDLQLAPLQLRSFREQRLKEIVLFREGEEYRLSFSFGGGEDAFSEQVAGEAPEYVLVIEMEHERALHHAVSSIAKEAA
ncbi:MAG: hypothetical protein N2441_06325 [Rhodocyclaceae bacterium]|nr:hypothetical protein [Rhodocyclaceae bacterium]